MERERERDRERQRERELGLYHLINFENMSIMKYNVRYLDFSHQTDSNR